MDVGAIRRAIGGGRWSLRISAPGIWAPVPAPVPCPYLAGRVSRRTGS